MITGADAITQMRKLDDIISEIENVTESEAYTNDPYDIVQHYATRFKTWRDEITKAGGIKPLQSYTELLSPGDTL